jgi:hypothetical protein
VCGAQGTAVHLRFIRPNRLNAEGSADAASLISGTPYEVSIAWGRGRGGCYRASGWVGFGCGARAWGPGAAVVAQKYGEAELEVADHILFLKTSGAALVARRSA